MAKAASRVSSPDILQRISRMTRPKWVRGVGKALLARLNGSPLIGSHGKKVKSERASECRLLAVYIPTNAVAV